MSGGQPIETEPPYRFLSDPVIVRTNRSLAALKTDGERLREKAFRAQLQSLEVDYELRAVQQELEDTRQAIQMISDSAASLTE